MQFLYNMSSKSNDINDVSMRSDAHQIQSDKIFEFVN